MVLGGFPVLSCSFPQRTGKIAKFEQISMISESEREIPCIFSLFSGIDAFWPASRSTRRPGLAVMQT